MLIFVLTAIKINSSIEPLTNQTDGAPKAPLIRVPLRIDIACTEEHVVRDGAIVARTGPIAAVRTDIGARLVAVAGSRKKDNAGLFKLLKVTA